MSKTKKAKENKPVVYTPIGRVSYPYLHKPDTGRPESDNKYKVELYIPKEAFQTDEGKALMKVILETGRKFFDDKKLSLKDFKNPFHDMSTDPKAEEWNKNCIRIRAKSQLEVPVIGPRKIDGKFQPLSTEKVKEIKGGDYGRAICTVGTYTQQGGGVTLYLNFFQFVKEGEALGQGNWRQLENLSEIEVEVDSVEDMVDTEEAADEDSGEDAGMVF